MRVAHVITRLIIGGAQENTLFNVDDQRRWHGDDVCLITGPGLGPEGSLEQHARHREVDLRIIPELRRSVHPWRDSVAYRRIKQLIREYRPDIVHTHSSKAGILGRRIAHSLGIPAVHTIHGAAFHFGQPVMLQRLYRAAERLAERWCQHIISVCDAMTRQYLAAGIGAPEKYTTIYSGMDVDRFLSPSESRDDVRSRLGLDEDHVVIVKVARLFHLKGHEYLIEAAPEVVRRNPQVRFLLVGDGILRSRYDRRIAELGLTQYFVFTGLVQPEKVTDYIHAGDIVAHASVWEGLARVLPQGLIAGKPIVSFDNDGAPEICLDGETGLLVPTRSIAPLAEALSRLASDLALRHRLGAEGRRRFTDPFRHEYMTERIHEVYCDVLRACPQSPFSPQETG